MNNKTQQEISKGLITHALGLARQVDDKTYTSMSEKVTALENGGNTHLQLEAFFDLMGFCNIRIRQDAEIAELKADIKTMKAGR